MLLELVRKLVFLWKSFSDSRIVPENRSLRNILYTYIIAMHVHQNRGGKVHAEQL